MRDDDEPLDPEEAAVFAALDQMKADLDGRLRYLEQIRLKRLAGVDIEDLEEAEQFAAALMQALGFEQVEIEGHGVVWRRVQK